MSTLQSTTIYSVAQLAGVSTATVSRALRARDKVSPDTYDKVMEAVERLHYIPRGPAASLARQSTGALGLVLPHITGWYYAELVVGFEMAASEMQQSAIVALANSRSDAERCVRELAERVDGLAFLARSAVPDSLIATISRARPVVTGARSQVADLDCLRTENAEPSRALTARLLASGRKRLLFLGDPEPGSDVALRYSGFRAAHLERGLAAPQARPVELEEEAGRRAVADLLASGFDADAVVCANDHIALAAIKEFQAAGVRVPDDVAVTGWDDLMAARYISPSLTTVSQPVIELGRLAALRLQGLVSGHAPDPTPIVLDSTLICRDSCGTKDASSPSTKEKK